MRSRPRKDVTVSGCLWCNSTKRHTKQSDLCERQMQMLVIPLLWKQGLPREAGVIGLRDTGYGSME